MKRIYSRLARPEIDTIISLAKNKTNLDIFEMPDSIIFMKKNVYMEIRHSSLLNLSDVYKNCIVVASTSITTLDEVKKIYDLAKKGELSAKYELSYSREPNITTSTGSK